jgi:hypothetical protein
LVAKVGSQSYMLEPNEVLKVSVMVTSLWGSGENFLGKVRSDGRILVPKFTLAFLGRGKLDLCLEGYVLEVTLNHTNPIQ